MSSWLREDTLSYICQTQTAFTNGSAWYAWCGVTNFAHTPAATLMRQAFVDAEKSWRGIQKIFNIDEDKIFQARREQPNPPEGVAPLEEYLLLTNQYFARK